MVGARAELLEKPAFAAVHQRAAFCPKVPKISTSRCLPREKAGMQLEQTGDLSSLLGSGRLAAELQRGAAR